MAPILFGTSILFHRQQARAFLATPGVGQLGSLTGIPQERRQPAVQQAHLRSACISQMYTTEVKSSTISPCKGHNTTKALGMGRSPHEAPTCTGNTWSTCRKELRKVFTLSLTTYKEHVCKLPVGNMKSASGMVETNGKESSHLSK